MTTEKEPKDAKTTEMVEGKPEDQTKEETTAEEKGKAEEPTKGKGAEGTEDFEQKFKTLQGMHKKTAEELEALRKERSDFGSLELKIDQVGDRLQGMEETIGLVVEAMSSSAEAGEEFQQKAQQMQQERKTRLEAHQKGREALTFIADMVDVAGKTMNDESLKDAKAAFNQGNYEEAKRLTKIALKGAGLQPKETEPEKEPSKEEANKSKESLKMFNRSPAQRTGTEGMTSADKIKAGMEERRENQ